MEVLTGTGKRALSVAFELPPSERKKLFVLLAFSRASRSESAGWRRHRHFYPPHVATMERNGVRLRLSHLPTNPFLDVFDDQAQLCRQICGQFWSRTRCKG